MTITAGFLLFPEQLFQSFMKEEQMIQAGIQYMKIIGIPHMFMCMELLTVGAFNGIGKTYIPPIFNMMIT